MNFVELIVASLLSLWFLLTILNQFPWKSLNVAKRYDIFALIPSWTFFAPNPGHTDYHLLYRDRKATGEYGPWIKIDLDSNRSLFSPLWNPVKRKNKALTDMVSDLMFFSGQYSLESISLTLSYLCLLNHVVHQDHLEGAATTEFVVMETHGYFNPKTANVTFESMEHAL